MNADLVWKHPSLNFFKEKFGRLFSHHNPLNTCFYIVKYSPASSVLPGEPHSLNSFPISAKDWQHSSLEYFLSHNLRCNNPTRTHSSSFWRPWSPYQKAVDEERSPVMLQRHTCMGMDTHHFQSCTTSQKKPWIDHQFLHLPLLQWHTNTLAVYHSPGFSVIWACGLMSRLKTKNN